MTPSGSGWTYAYDDSDYFFNSEVPSTSINTYDLSGVNDENRHIYAMDIWPIRGQDSWK